MTYAETTAAIAAATTRIAEIDQRQAELVIAVGALTDQLAPLHNEQGALAAEASLRAAELLALQNQLYAGFTAALAANPKAASFEAVGRAMDNAK